MRVKITCGVKNLTLHLIILCLKQVNVVSSFDTLTPDGCSQELGGSIAKERDFEGRKVRNVLLEVAFKFFECYHNSIFIFRYAFQKMSSSTTTAGDPDARVKFGNFPETTERAPTITPAPIFAPGIINPCSHIQEC